MSFLEAITSIPYTAKVLFICFIAFSIFEIVLAFLEKELLRRIVKPLCLLFLGVSVTIALPTHKFLYLATYFAMTGDILLLSKRNKVLFPLGTTAFLIGHIFYYVEINTALLPTLNIALPWWFHVVYWVVVMVLTFSFSKPIRKLFKFKPIMSLGSSFYYTVLCASVVMYIIATIGTIGSGIGTYMWLAIIGAAFFVFSDFFLGYVKFVKDVKRRDFYVMLTYLLAEALIILAFTLTYYSNPGIFTF